MIGWFSCKFGWYSKKSLFSGWGYFFFVVHATHRGSSSFFPSFLSYFLPFFLPSFCLSFCLLSSLICFVFFPLSQLRVPIVLLLHGMLFTQRVDSMYHIYFSKVSQSVSWTSQGVHSTEIHKFSATHFFVTSVFAGVCRLYSHVHCSILKDSHLLLK